MRNRGVIIELTALLDVILVIMFLLLVQSGEQVATANQTANESLEARTVMASELEGLKHESEILYEENARMRRYINEQILIDKNTMAISLSVQTLESGRFISVEAEGALKERISLEWDRQNYAANALNAVLSEIIRETDAQVVFIMFEYDRSSIYQSDYALIVNAIQKQKRFTHVYTAEYDINSQKGGLYNEREEEPGKEW